VQSRKYVVLSPTQESQILEQQAPFLPTPTGVSLQDLHTSPLVEGVYRNKKCAGPRHETDVTILRVSRQLSDETTPIYYRINAFLYTQLEIHHFCESISRVKAAHMKHVSLRIRSDFTGTSHKLQRLERLLSSLLGLACLKVTISQEAFCRYSAHWQDPEKGNCMATSADLENALLAPTSEEKKWIRRWVVDTTSIHF
jgi:hypothetical protein